MALDPIEIPMEDAPIHTDENPFCDDMTCPCHEDGILIGEVANQVNNGTLTPGQADNIYRGRGR